MVKLVLLFALTLFASAGDLKALLKKYEASSELSLITKKETAGFVDVFTAADLSRMQAYTLKDVLQKLPLLTHTLTPNNLHLFTAGSSSYIPPSAIRLYINDHDVTSTSFGSASLVWGDMPVEYIDHIEVYRGSSSIEFGNEPGMIVIKVYTKLAKREVGNKLRAVTDHRHSRGIDAYTAKILGDNSDLFAYGHYYLFRPKIYYNEGYRLDRGKEENLFYLNYRYGKHTFELSNMAKSDKPFLGHGRLYHPLGGGLDAHHFYFNYTYDYDKETRFNISYDNLGYERHYKDESGIFTTIGYVQDYELEFTDSIFSVQAQKTIHLNKSDLFLGGFVKRKGFEKDGSFDGATDSAKNHFYLTSLYGDYHYRFDPSSLLILSLKLDRYVYDKKVPSKTEYIARLGLLKAWENFKAKLFLTRTYLTIPFYKLCSCNNLPLNANEHLKNPKVVIGTLSLEYEKNGVTTYLRLGKKSVKKRIYYDRKTRSFQNLDRSLTLSHIEFGQSYKKGNTEFSYVLYKMKNSKKVELSPDFGAIFSLYQDYEKWNLYHQLIYKSAYNHYGYEVEDSLDYTLAIKYHFNRDFSVGFRGENLFATGFEQKYLRVDKPIPVNDRRYIFNLEYRF
jgi:iron complex outermembrane receptor protein